jgi:asparagine synthase (glutamine-hydrolysing)
MCCWSKNEVCCAGKRGSFLSQIYGIFNRAAKVRDGDIECMALAVRACKPDIEQQWRGSRVAMGCQLVWNTPESKYDHQPRCAETLDGNVVLVADLRLDNRAWLAAELGIAARRLTNIPDSELLLLGYLRWGNQLPEFLLGDFVFVIWDERRHEFFCARDHLGIKLLYYHLSEEHFFFASDLRALRRHPAVPPGFDLRTVALYLNEGEPMHPDRTFLSSIKKLRPAHTLTVSMKESSMNAYWRPEDVAPLDAIPAEDFPQLLRGLLEESVSCRMRTDFPVACHLSGGLDSSAITALAASCAGSASLKTFNWVSAPGPDDDPKHFEWALSKLVADSLGLNHEYVSLTKARLNELIHGHDLADGDSTDLWYEYLVREGAVAGKCRTILSGWGGDELVSAAGNTALTELFWHGRPIWTLQEIIASARSAPRPLRSALGSFYRSVVRPCYPWSRGSRISEMGYTGCAKPHFQQFCRKQRGPILHLPQFSIRGAMLDLLRFGYLQNRVECWAVSGNRSGLEYRYPLLDKRIVEFALGLPPDQFRQQGVNRYIFRQAIGALVPDGVRLAPKIPEIERVSRYSELQRQVFSSLDLDLEFPNINGAAVQPIELNMLFAKCLALEEAPSALEDLIDVIDLVSRSYLTARMFTLDGRG